MKPTSHDQPSFGIAAQQRAQVPLPRPQSARARVGEQAQTLKEVSGQTPPRGWDTSQKPSPMQPAFVDLKIAEQQKLRPARAEQQTTISSAQKFAAASSRTNTISGAEITQALKLTDQQMQTSMGPIARRGYLYLTRFGSTMSLLGAAGAAASIVAGGSGFVSGLGLPVGGLAALAGVAVMVGGLAASSLAGAAARSISRSALRDNPMLRQKMDTLRRMHSALAQKPQRTNEESTLLTDVESVLKRCDSSFASALVRTAKSALKAPFVPILGANMVAQTLSEESSDILRLHAHREAVTFKMQGNEQFAMSPAMARWTHVLAAIS